MIFKNLIKIRFPIRCFSASKNLIDIKINDTTGVATVSLNKLPVNALNYELLESLHKTLVKLETERCRGMILTSTSPKVFCAGLDINELYKPSLENARSLWTKLQDVWIKLYSSPYPTVAAINGHSPAGGCLLSVSCEYRIIVPNVTIGPNETQLGIIPPEWFQNCIRNTIGERLAEKALISGQIFTSEEALLIGLVDEMAIDKSEAIKKAEDFIETQINLPSLARSSIKLQFRSATLTKMLNTRELDIKIFTGFIFNPKVQERLKIYIENIKNKNKK